MALILLVLAALTLLTATIKHTNTQRKRWILIATGLLSILIIANQYYLSTLGLVFQPSDPEHYFNIARNAADYAAIVQDTAEASNTYYYLLNRLYIDTFEEPWAVSIALLLTNLWLFMAAYLYGTKNFRFATIEYFLLAHPYLALIAIRNVRDLHILSLSIIIFSLALTHRNTLQKGIIYAGLAISRPFYVAIILLARFAEKNKASLTKIHIYSTVIGLAVLLGVLLISSNSFYHFTIERMVAGYGFYNEYNATYEQLKLSWLTYDRSLKFAYQILTIFCESIAKFIFTPILPSYLEKYLSQNNSIYLDIYTTLDMMLIFLGIIVNVFYFIPIFLKLSWENLKNPNLIDSPFIAAILIVLIYSFAHLGGTDIRIRYSFIFAFCVSIIFTSRILKIQRTRIISIFLLIVAPSILLLLRIAF